MFKRDIKNSLAMLSQPNPEIDRQNPSKVDDISM